jgi:HSP20 family protein
MQDNMSINLKIGEQNMVPARKFNGLSSLPDFFNDFFDNGGIDRISTKAPAINVIEDDDRYKIEVATPGMTKDDFKIHVNKDGNLVIEMEKKKENEEKKDKKYIRKEFAYTRFHQTLILPENAEKDKIEAKVENGVLKVCIPKMQNEIAEPEKRVIEVK